MASNNEYKVKVGVEFNAIMTKVNSALDSLQDRLKKLGSLTGAKDVTSGLSEGLQKIVNGFNELKDFTITPKNLNEYIGKLQVLEEELKAIGLSSKDINQNLFNDKNGSAAGNIQKANDEIKKLESNIEALNKKKAENSTINPFTEKDAQDLKNYEQELQKTQKSLSGYTAYQTRLKHASESLGVTEEQLAEILRLLAQAHKEAADASEKQREGQQELDSTKLADTIRTQVNQYIGLAAIYRYTKKYIQDLVQTYKEFDQSLVAIAAVTGQTRDQMWANIGVYNKMAQSLGTTTQEVINASKLYYQQGLTTTSVLKLTEETVKLATIAELDSADATEYLTTAMNGFKLSAEESTRVTDVWANLAAKTASDVDELAVAISKVASLAENAGMEIETASAFLNQMIETTREAPENLGTALKTIIARFQELKTSEEELSDGVDANKVERALKTAGVALRDASGQFRDFDDVILELSSKWDSLDRNTQRYIATIAAGSRQQSRFIALVSDYEGLLRNVNYAYDSLGSADAQMAVFQEGLAASTNRLQAAWEGLYTSWSKSATVISKLIDGMADFVSTLADLGAGWSAAIAGLVLLTATITTNAIALQLQQQKVAGVAAAFGVYIPKAAGATSANIELALSTAGVVAGYVALAAIVLALGYGIIKAINYEKDYIKLQEKEAQQALQLAAKTKDEASSLGVLVTELEDAKKAGEDIEAIRQKIIDQFGDEIKWIDIEGKSAEELIEILKELQRQKEGLAAKEYIQAAEERAEADFLNSEAYKNSGAKVGWKFTSGKNGHLAIKTVFRYNGQTYDSEEELARAILKEVNNSSALTDGESDFITKAIIDSGAIERETDLTAGIIKNFINRLDDESRKAIFDDDGIITPEAEQRLSNLNDIVSNVYNTLSDTNKINLTNILNGSLNGVSFGVARQLISELDEAGADSELIVSLQRFVDQFENNLANTFASAVKNGNLTTQEAITIRSQLLPGAQKAFIDTFNSLANDPTAQQAYTQAILNLLSKGIPQEDLTASLISAFGDLDQAMSQYSALLSGYGKGTEENAEQLEALKDAVGEANAAYLEGMDIINDYYGLMDDISTLMEGSLSDDDFAVRIEALKDGIEALGYATRQEINDEIDAAIVRNELGQQTLQATEWIKEMTDAIFNEGEATVETKKKEILAYAANLEAVGDRLIAIGDEMIAQEKSGHANSVATQALLENAALEAEALVEVKNAALEAYDATEGGTGSVMAEQSRYFAKVAKDIRAGMSGAQVKALGQQMKQRAAGLRQLANNLSMTQKALDKTGKSAGKAAKETDKLKDALEGLKDALEDAKTEAEGYIDSVLEFLDKVQKDEEDKLEKERNLLKIQLQEWKNYIDGRQELAQEELELQGKAADMYFNQEIAAIQAKIDALDDEAEAEDRLLKLQKARDDYNKAQNSRTRLVLTKGAGWIFKTDQNEVTNARKALNDVQREIQKANYQKQLDDLQAQATAWQEIAEKIGESAAEAERLEKALKAFTDAIGQEGGYADIDAYTAAVKAQQSANDEYAKLSAEVDKWLEQADWEYQDILDSEMAKRFTEQFQNGTVDRDDLAAKVGNIDEIVAAFGKDFDDYWSIDTKLQEEGLSALQNIAESYHLLKNLEDTETFYNTQKAQLGLTKDQLKVAEEIRDAIQRAYDPTAENLGLGENSKYYNATILDLIQQVQDYAEQIAALEAQQAQQSATDNSSSGNSGGGGGSSGGYSGGGNSGITTTYTSQEPTTLGRNLLNSISTGGTQYDPLGTARGSISTSTINSQSLSKTDNKNTTNNYYVSLNTNANNLNSLVQDIKRSTSVYAVH